MHWTSDQGQPVISFYPLADCLIAQWTPPGILCNPSPPSPNDHHPGWVEGCRPLVAGDSAARAWKMDVLLWLTSAPPGLPQVTPAALLLERVAATAVVGLPLEQAAAATAALLAWEAAVAAVRHLERTVGPMLLLGRSAAVTLLYEQAAMAAAALLLGRVAAVAAPALLREHATAAVLPLRQVAATAAALLLVRVAAMVAATLLLLRS